VEGRKEGRKGRRKKGKREGRRKRGKEGKREEGREGRKLPKGCLWRTPLKVATELLLKES
jgi:hypothetical protein